MRILCIATFYHPHWTGLSVHAWRVATGLAARGHQVTVLTTRHSRELACDELVEGVRVVRLQPALTLTRTMLCPAFPLAAAQLIAQHDVVQIHSPLAEALLVALLCRLQGRPLLMTHHGDLVMPPGAVNRFIERFAFSTLRLTGELAGAVTSYSDDYAEHSPLLRRLHDKVTSVYPPVVVPAPDPAAAAAWRRELGLEGRLLIGFAGRWVSEKGFDYLLRAFPAIRAAFPEAHLVFAGEANITYERFYHECQPLIAAQRERLTMLGLIRDPQALANFYHMCDLFLLPSRTDMMALVQIEAMLCGTPVVAADIPGARVVVRETGFGQLAPPNDADALAQTVIATLRDLGRYRPHPAAVQAIFDPERTLDQYEGLMRALVEGRLAEGRAAPPVG